MLYKNFGVTRLGRVVFYDYDEIEYMTDCTFRRIPKALHEETTCPARWYLVDKRDVFPEHWGPFLLGDAHPRRLHEAPRRPAHARVLEGAQGAHPGAAT
jgi:isocitrate dehydrogenase kinase/phosphatase